MEMLATECIVPRKTGYMCGVGKSISENPPHPPHPSRFGLPRASNRVILLHMLPLARRLSKLEARRPARGPVHMIDASLLDPAVLALWLSVDIDKMSLAQLDLLEANLRKLS